MVSLVMLHSSHPWPWGDLEDHRPMTPQACRNSPQGQHWPFSQGPALIWVTAADTLQPPRL